MAEWKRPKHWATRELRVAEPGPKARGDWYVLRVRPGFEIIAAEHMTGRGFGVYVPMRRAWVDGLNVQPCHPAPELVGYLYAFLWPADLDKVVAVPYVNGYMLQSEQRAIIADATIRQWRQREAKVDWGLVEHLSEIDLGAKRPAKRKRRRRKSKRIGKG